MKYRLQLVALLMLVDSSTALAATNLQINVAGNLRGCGMVPVTVTALNADGSVDTAYAGRVVVNGAPGTWAPDGGAGLFEVAPPDGDAAYTFAALDQGIAHFILSPPATGAFTVSVFDSITGLAASSRSVGDAPYNGAGFADGLLGTYFNYVPWEVDPPPFPEPPNALTAVGTRIDGPMNFNWNRSPMSGVNEDGFTTNWTGVWRAPATGWYRFHIWTRDDGVRLEVDGSQLIDQWLASRWNAHDISAPVFMTAGSTHDLKIHYYDRYNQAVFRLETEHVGFGGPAPIPVQELRACQPGAPPPPASLAAYHFEETAWSGTANDVLDSSGNGWHAMRLGTVAGVATAPALNGNPGSCRKADIELNNDTTRNGFDTGINVGADIGRAGTIAFWYRSEHAWASGAKRYLFDASTPGGGSFALFVESGGGASAQLRFVYNDPSRNRRLDLWSWGGYAVPADTWVHIVFGWDFDTRRARIVIRDAAGNLLPSGESRISLGGMPPLATLGNLVVGDNASTNQDAWYENPFWPPHPASADGDIDEVLVYSGLLDDTSIANLWRIRHDCAAADHFSITHAGTAVNCDAAALMIAAHDISDAVFGGYTGTISVSTSTGHGDWSLPAGGGSGTLTNAGDGNATYAFAAADNGEVSLRLRNTFAETLSVDITDGTIAEAGDEDDDLDFVAAGFIVTSDHASGEVPVQISGKSSDTGYMAAALALKAVRTDDDTGACAALLAGNVDVEVAAICTNPTACGSPAFSMNGTAVGVSAPASPTYADVPFVFDNTVYSAPFTFAHDGAGKLQLKFRYDLDADNAVEGASNEFVVRPFALLPEIPTNPGATAPSGSVFTSAGTPFKASIRAVAWQAGDDNDNDGIPDGHNDTDVSNNIDLSDNSTVSNYGSAGGALETALLTARLVLPASGTSPALAGSTEFAAFTNGESDEQNVRFDEAGIIEIKAAPKTAYLGLSATETARMIARSGAVGRFRADHLVTSVQNHGCSDTDNFTYSAQPLGKLYIEARNAAGNKLDNYTWDSVTNNGFAKLVTLSDPNAASPGTFANGGIDPSDFDTGSVTLNDVGFAFTSVRLPYGLRIRATDSDSATSSGHSEGVTEVRAGRLALHDTHSPNFVPASMSVYVESWRVLAPGWNGWDVETQDACTNPAFPGDVMLDQFSDPAVAGVTPVALTLSSGLGSLRLSAPGPGNNGTLRVRIDAPEWLEFDWSGSGAEDPAATATYGELYRTESGFIHRNEIY